jgi:hypothetical protein
MPDDILIRFSVKDDGTPVIERVNQSLKKTKKETQALAPGLEKARQGLTGFVSANAALIGVLAGVGTALASAFNEYSRYAESVRDFSLVTGTNAEEASRFIQVLDDYQLTVEDATQASRFLKEKGLVPNIDTLVQLSNQFKQIQDPAQRLEFIQENLGRGGAKWVNILNQEESALRDLAGSIDKNLILSDEQIKKYEQQRLALDALSDKWQGFKVQIGSAVGNLILENEAMTKANKIFVEQGGILTMNYHLRDDYKKILAEVKAEMEAEAEATRVNTEAMKQNEEANRAQEEVRKSLSEHLSSQIGLIGQIQSAEENYTKQSADLASQRAEAEAELATLRAQGYWEQSEQIQDQLAKLDEIKTREAELAEERAKQSLQFISNILAEQLARDGWTQSEFDAFAEQQLAWGLWSEEAVKASQAAWQEADKIAASINAIPTDKTVTVTVVSQGVAAYQASERASTPPQFRDSGGPGYAGQTYMIGTGAQPELFTPSQGGTFTPNADKNLIDYDKLARTFRDVMLAVGR